MMSWCLKGCSRCGGDLALQEEEWRCWQCGHYYYANLLGPGATFTELASPPLEGVAPGDPAPRGPGRPRRYGGPADRDINRLIRARTRSDEKWWARHHQIVAYLEEGLPARDIASIMAQSERRIREVRERLAEMRETGARKEHAQHGPGPY